jgi:NAD(P)H dehydrogenase (quinone)
MSNPTLLVSGAAGQLGRRVLELLLDAPGARTILATTRRPAALADLAARGVEVRLADFDAPADLPAAFAGAGRALLISTDALDRPGRRIEQHGAAIAALERAGVAHVVYTSAPVAPSLGQISDDHRGTEAALVRSTLDHTILRNQLYADFLLSSLAGAVATGQLADARGTGAAAWVTREDCARAAAAALLDGVTGRRTFDITGPALLSSPEVARLAAELTGRPVVHAPISIEAKVAGLVAHGVPAPLAQIYAAFDTAIARGELAVTSDAVHQLTGRPPQSLQAFLAANRAALGA